MKTSLFSLMMVFLLTVVSITLAAPIYKVETRSIKDYKITTDRWDSPIFEGIQNDKYVYTITRFRDWTWNVTPWVIAELNPPIFPYIYVDGSTTYLRELFDMEIITYIAIMETPTPPKPKDQRWTFQYSTSWKEFESVRWVQYYTDISNQVSTDVAITIRGSEPSTLFLLSSLLTGLVGFGRKRQAKKKG